MVEYGTANFQLVDKLVTITLVGNFIALNLEKMRKYHRKCIKDWNGCYERHGYDVEDGHFTENGI
jgi:hypothetical protein